MKQMIARFCQRYNPAAVWKDCNPILEEGEMGVESDTRLFKFGDGITPWRDLQYAVTGGGGYAEVDETLTEMGKPADARAAGLRITALENELAKMNYSINFTFDIQSATPSKKTGAEIGESFTNIVLKWTATNKPVSVQINGVNQDVSTNSGETTVQGPVTQDTVWTLVGKGEFDTSVTKTTSIKFYRCAYCGTYVPGVTEITEQYLQDKCSRIYLKNNKSFEFNINVKAGERPFFAWPYAFEPMIGLVDGGVEAALTGEFITDFKKFPTEYDDIYQTQYYLWAFAKPPATAQNWKIKVS